MKLPSVLSKFAVHGIFRVHRFDAGPLQSQKYYNLKSLLVWEVISSCCNLKIHWGLSFLQEMHKKYFVNQMKPNNKMFSYS